MFRRRWLLVAVLWTLLSGYGGRLTAAPLADDPTPPTTPVKLIFIHHSTGENWLADDNGGLGIALRNANYFVSDTNYGWGPADADVGGGTIGDHTDIGHWYNWFVGPHRDTYLTALYAESGQHASYSRLNTDPGGPNEIILFKSCFPNSHLGGNPTDPPTTGANPLRGQDAYSEYHTVANAKGIYNDLLSYFAAHQEKLFIVIAQPPLASNDTDAAHAANARAFTNWLLNDWLAAYPYKNVAVFNFYNVLTSNGGNANTNDAGQATGNHHRWWEGAVQHLQTVANNFLAYPTGDSHPSQAGNLKATAEFVPLLNVFYHRWKSAAQLTLTVPNGGELWPVNRPYQIRWTTTGNVPQVNLAYSTDGFVTRYPIATTLTNTGVYTWTTPLTPSKTMRVRVESTLSPTTVFAVSAANFTLYDPAALTRTVFLPLVMRAYTAETVRAWPDTTEGIHVFNDQLAGGLTEAQIAFAATHYAGTQKMTRADADHLRQYNPNFIILHYRLGLGLGYRSIQGTCTPNGDWLEIIEGNQWVQEWPTAPQEAWFFQWNGQRVLNCDWGWYLVDPDNAAWRSYWSGEVLRQLRANADDGLFADSVSVPNYLGNDRFSPALPAVDAAFESAWAGRIERLIAFMQQGALAPYYFIPNVGQWVTTRDPTNYAGADGVMIEGLGEWGQGAYFELADWQLQLDRILSLVQQNKVILAQQYVNVDDINERLFVLGTYLLSKGRATYLNLELDLDPEWFPEYTIPIGHPLGTLPANSAALWYAPWGVYTRTYSNGLVLVNPTATSRTISLGGVYYRATPQGGGFVPPDGDVSAWTVTYAPVSAVTLAPNRAAILLNAAP